MPSPSQNHVEPSPTPVTVAYGDGIGPEIMSACLRMLEAAGARIAPEVIEIGEKVYGRGHSTGIEDSAWESLLRTQVFLKAPITTPQGGGVKSLNVTVRKTLGLFANVRPTVSYHPYVTTKHPKMNMVIVRENEEDLYAGIEHQQTAEVTQCLKLISREGSERIVRYAFEYAVQNGRKKITCISKDNIMKITDGLFHRVFNEVAEEYPQIETDHMIVDIGAARIADTPEWFDVIVTENLYGDILSDIAAQVAGSVGLAGSANVGVHCAMFEAIHGSAPVIAGQNIANPSGLLQAAIMMLVHVGQGDVANRVHNAWLRTLEDGVHTKDIHSTSGGATERLVGTKEFADAVIERMGKDPMRMPKANYPAQGKPIEIKVRPAEKPEKRMVGVDIFLDSVTSDTQALGDRLKTLAGDKMELAVVVNRGVKVWPGVSAEVNLGDLWQCRFMAKPDGHPERSEGSQAGNEKASSEPRSFASLWVTGILQHSDITALLDRIASAGLDFVKFESLCTFDGKRGYSLAQGQ
jgi:isocitrate dehydrogenase